MSVYFVLTQTITDPDRYSEEYIPAVMPFLAKYGGEVLAADFQATPLQGEPAAGAVIVKFPSESSLREFLDDPTYQPVKALRLSITTSANAVMVPEFQPPK